MNVYIRPFNQKGSTVNLAVAGTSSSVAVTRSGVGTQSVRIVNSGAQTVFLNFGVSTVAATLAAGMPMLPNTVESFLLLNDVTHIAAIAAATGSTIYITTGESA